MLCDPCHHRLAELLQDVALFLPMLDDVRWHAVENLHDPGVKLRSVASEKAPLNLAVTVLEDRRTRPRLVVHDDGTVTSEGPVSLAGTLSGWCDLVIEERRLSDEPHTVPQCLVILRQHLEWIAGRPWVGDMFAEVDELHRQLGDVVGEPRPRPIGRCPVDDCGAPLWMPGDDWSPLECRACGAEWPRERWGVLAAALAGGAA